MKPPSLRQLKIDRTGTKNIRTALWKKRQVTITVHLNPADLRAAKSHSKKAEIPYQRLFSTLLATSARQQESMQARLNRLEQELRKIKRRIAA
jgi:predicted DNA binding CopG/RHH family protein